MPSLLPCLYLALFYRPTTERRPRELPASKKCFLLRLPSKRVDFIPKKVDLFPEIVAYPPNKKSPLKAIFLAQSKIIHYLCGRNEKIPKMSSEIIKHTAQPDLVRTCTKSFELLLSDLRQIIENGRKQAYNAVEQAGRRYQSKRIGIIQQY